MRIPLWKVLPLLVLAGCGVRAGGERAPEVIPEVYTIHVEHNIIGAPTATIHVQEALGQPRFLGGVLPGETQTFELRSPASGRLRLVAELPDGRRVLSRPFFLVGEGARWNLRANLVQTIQAQSGEGETDR